MLPSTDDINRYTERLSMVQWVAQEYGIPTLIVIAPRSGEDSAGEPVDDTPRWAFLQVDDESDILALLRSLVRDTADIYGRSHDAETKRRMVVAMAVACLHGLKEADPNLSLQQAIHMLEHHDYTGRQGAS